ncbi:ribonuclease E/G [Rhodobacteraceae bacterium CCMM004]|nr:ribonuclease E/G [Rhodobacteraceae bacterium CCMM004]
MSKKMLIDATHPEETRVVVVDGNKVEEFDFESENKRQLAGNIYLAKITRVEPSLQAAFVDYGGNRHGFLAFSEVHPDYYQIPVADREALLAEEAELAAEAEAEEDRPKPKSRSRSRSRSRVAAKTAAADDAVDSVAPEADPGDTPDTASDGEADADAQARTMAIAAEIPGMDVVDVVATDARDDAHEDDAQEADAETDEAPADDAAPQDDDPQPYVAADEAAERDANIESVADDDVTDEIRRPRKPRARKYKIQEVIKVRQIMLVQVVKEERGNKGAALTTYLSLAGRYCVLMPNTARGGGISRKITNAADRKKLKEIAASIEVPRGAGLIVRTAGAKRTKTEIKRDYEYLQRLWEQIRELTLKSIAPAPIYEEGNLIKRSIRDLYNRDIDEVLVEGAEGYRTAKDFMKMIMPSHAKNVKNYHDQMPLFARHQVESYLGAMFNPTVQLKSGGYIVIGVTEALVAIDVNSGKATKEGSIEETALKTNLEAADEVARQLRLRDLAGLIVIDFIDMEERKNNAAVEKRFKDKLKTDRARIQVGRISAFGLLEMSRQRLRPGMIEATTQPCPHCHGTGLLRSDDNLSLNILRQLEEEGVRNRTKEVLVTVPVGIANFLMNHKREHIAQIEARYGMAVRIEADAMLISPDYKIEKFKTQSGRVVRQTAPVVSVDAQVMSEIDAEEAAEAEEAAAAVEEAPAAAEATAEERNDEGQTKKRRRRRRRRGKGSGAATDGQAGAEEAAERESASEEGAVDSESAPQPVASDDDAAPVEAQSGPDDDAATPSEGAEEARVPDAAPAAEEGAAAPEPAEDTSADEATAGAAVPEEVAERISQDAPVAPPLPEEAEPASDPEPAHAAGNGADPSEAPEHEPEPESEAADPAPEDDAAAAAAKPKRRGWWSMGR